MTTPAAAAVAITVDGERVATVAGLPLGAVLHARSATLRRTARDDRPRGLFCGTGVCFECLVTVDGRPGVRACITPVRDGMEVVLG